MQPLYRLYSAHVERGPRAGPSAGDIARMRRLVDYRAVEVGPDRVRLGRPGMGITLNGIAQGFITDRVADLLRADGFEDVLVDLGEARALGRQAEGRAWRAGIRDPRDPKRTLFELALDGANTSALATSAGYGTPLGDDPRIHHLLDPHTGASANHHLSVSVTAPRALVADALSTTLFSCRRNAWSPCSRLIRKRGLTSSLSRGGSCASARGRRSAPLLSENPPAEVAHGYERSCPDFVCVVTLTVTGAAGQSGSVSMRMGFLDQTPD